MRDNRLPYKSLPKAEKRAANARSYANVYIRRGKLIPQPCRTCGVPTTRKHIPDPAKPLEVVWLCQTHLMIERQIRKIKAILDSLMADNP